MRNILIKAVLFNCLHYTKTHQKHQEEIIKLFKKKDIERDSNIYCKSKTPNRNSLFELRLVSHFNFRGNTIFKNYAA